MRHGPSRPALRALDTIHDRIESSADKLLRSIEPWSSYAVLPLFALAGIGFTMSLFIAGQAFPSAADFAAAKIAIFLASLIAGGLGALILWPRAETDEKPPDASQSSGAATRGSPAARPR